MSLYVYSNKDWKNIEQNRKIFRTFFIIDIILVVSLLITGLFVYNKIQDINKYKQQQIQETESDTDYTNIINDIKGNDKDSVGSKSDIEKFNEKEERSLGNEYSKDDYFDNLVSSYDGNMSPGMIDAIEESEGKITSNLDALKKTLYLESEYYKSKIKAHDYVVIENPDFIDYGEDGFDCERDGGFDVSTVAGMDACAAYSDKHLERYMHDPSDEYFNETEGVQLSYALNNANKPTETNTFTGRSFADSNHSIQGWLFDAPFESTFFTPYPISYTKVLDNYIRFKLYNRSFKNIENPVIVKANGKEKKDKYTVAAYLVFSAHGRKYKASFYRAMDSYKLLDIELS